MADAEEAARLLLWRLEKHDEILRELVLRHQEWKARQAQAQVDPAEEAERLQIVRMFEEA
jgi:hypothetical protein